MNKILIAKPGKNVLTDTTADDLIFSSDYNTLKYFMSGVYTMTNITTTTNAQVAHNLGYIPFFIVFCNDPVTNTSRYAQVDYYNTFIAHFVACRAYADANNLYFSTNIGGTSPTAYTINYKYKIFRNSLGL